ncbi:MFS transporter [Paenibacillus sp. ACRRX]|uniref:CynX/NimT family MFS transporter n=1 Tax=Paenibacillus sp. ACRRX TaxID=2918206 RepID=UPI001EF69CBC|nr:MFS transporter [Paenibacillus sp. ACRRX]MCG7408166.1 MFS transporter [Paenibacillus sp. ACRRX]
MELQHQPEQRSVHMWNIIGLFAIAVNLRAAITSVGPLINQIREETGLSSGMSGMLTALPLLAFALLSPIAPKLAKRWGQEVTIGASMLVLAIGLIIRYLPALSTLYMGTAIIGVGIAICNVLLPSYVVRKFPPSKIGRMTGLYSIALGMFAAVSAAVSVPLATAFGWRGSLFSWIVLLVVSWFLFLPQIIAGRREAAQQEKIQTATVAQHQEPKGKLWSSKVAWYVALFMGLQSFGAYVLYAWMPALVADRGFSASTSALMLTIVQLVNMPSMFLATSFASRNRSQSLIIVCIAVVGLVGYSSLFTSSLLIIIVGSVLIGICQGGSFSVALYMISIRARGSQQAAELSGMAQAIGYTLAATGPILFGWLHDQSGNWSVPLIFLLMLTCLQLIFGYLAGKDRYVTAAPEVH